MKALDRKLARDLLGAKGLLLAIATIIVVGMTCFVAAQSAYQNLRLQKARYYKQCRMADFWIDVKKAPVVETAALGSIPGILEVDSRIVMPATVDLDHTAEPLNALVVSLPDRRSRIVNDIVLRMGGYFSPSRQNEILVNDAFAAAHRIYPGQRIRLLLNKRREEFHVVGTAISSEFTYLVGPGSLFPDPERFGVFYIKQSLAEDLFDMNGAANQFVGRLAPQAGAAALARAEVLLDDYGVFSVTPLSQQVSNQFLSSEITSLGVTATIIPLVFLIIAALVLNVLITRLARRQRTVVGTLKAMGYSDGRVFVHFLVFGLSVGIVGGLLGSGLGYLAATGMTTVYRQYFEFPELRSGFYVYTHAIGLVVSMGCAVAGSLQGARAMLRLKPAEAMRPEPPRQGRAVWLERFPRLWRSLSSAWRMSLRNLVRNRVRTAVSVFAAAMGSGLLVTGFIMMEIQDYLIDFQFRRTIRSDYELVFDRERDADALDEVRRLPGVDLAEPILGVPCTLYHGPYRRKGGVTGLAHDARLTVPRNHQGRAIRMPDSGIVLTRRLADILHASVGDSITMVPVRGERRGIPVRVVAIADTFLGLAAYADIDYLGRIVDGQFVMNGAQLKCDGRASHRNEMYRQLKAMPEIESVQARKILTEKLVETLVATQYVFIGFLVPVAGTIFFGSIVNSSLISLNERLREVATFRAFGYGPWSIGTLFLRENLLTSLAGGVLGCPIGYGLMRLTAFAYRQNDLVRLPVVWANWVLWTTLALTCVFALVAHAVVQYRIHRVNTVDALKTSE